MDVKLRTLLLLAALVLLALVQSFAPDSRQDGPEQPAVVAAAEQTLPDADQNLGLDLRYPPAPPATATPARPADGPELRRVGPPRDHLAVNPELRLHRAYVSASTR